MCVENEEFVGTEREREREKERERLVSKSHCVSHSLFFLAWVRSQNLDVPQEKDKHVN